MLRHYEKRRSNVIIMCDLLTVRYIKFDVDAVGLVAGHGTVATHIERQHGMGVLPVAPA